ncbi:MAG TPA: DUF805 domain-containing protein [Allosphingosinicella sp.]|nr:DUF805 domain-containing protein [Allosphingosinicella sp.]
MNWAILPLKRYSDYGGRSRRKEFWLFQLLMLVLSVITGALDFALGLDRLLFDSMGPLTFATFAALVTPSLAVAIRRLHDIGRSGWWLLMIFVPILGLLVLIYFFVLEGTRGPNGYGPDPLETERAGAAGAV